MREKPAANVRKRCKNPLTCRLKYARIKGCIVPQSATLTGVFCAHARNRIEDHAFGFVSQNRHTWRSSSPSPAARERGPGGEGRGFVSQNGGPHRKLGSICKIIRQWPPL